ncbi:MAG: porin family protein, partial [Tenuifilaceae bacterium]|nr:porin family protein [Tenuifilaceae bacterium]
MKTKFISITLMIILSSTLAFAQNDNDSKTSFAILGGVNMQNLNGKNISGNDLKNDMIIGYHAGINVQVPIAPQFYFQPGLMFSTKGAKNEFTILGVTTKNTYKISYIELPLNILYKAQVGTGYIMLGFGPYVAYGIGGNHTLKVGSITTESKIKFKNELDLAESLTGNYFKPFDA